MEKQRYIRTSEGYILENTTEAHADIIKALENEDISAINKFGEIVKREENIIDLIENGDFIKIEISEEFVEKEDKIKTIGVGEIFTVEEFKERYKEDIDNGIYKMLSIVTKERFEEIEYIVESED